MIVNKCELDIPKELSEAFGKNAEANGIFFKPYVIQLGKNEDQETLWYRPICNDEEIARIKNVRCIDDYLLKLRADAVVDEMRLFRVMLARIKRNPEHWNFTDHFSEVEFKSYLSKLPRKQRRRWRKVGKGYVFDCDPIGKILKTPYGELITVSESLRYFLYYMNLFFLKFRPKMNVPDDVRRYSLLIAIRTMLGNEAMDFELDPRGKIPPEIDAINNEVTSIQLEFVIGHEYAHFHLGHLAKEYLKDASLRISPKLEIKRIVKYINRTHQEHEADLASINSLRASSNEIRLISWYAMIFFLYIYWFESVKSQLYPSINYVGEHPEPLDRIWVIFDKYKHKLMASPIDRKYLEEVIEWAENIRLFLHETGRLHPEIFDTYGSVYLGSWRGPVLKDRVDY